MPLSVSFRGNVTGRGFRAARSTRFVIGSANVATLTKSQRRQMPGSKATAAPPTASVAPAGNNNQELYVCDFYENIWHTLEYDEKQPRTKIVTADGVRTARRRRNQRKKRLIDISQVAHVLTTAVDYKAEYPAFAHEGVNVWGSSPRSTFDDLRSSIGDSDPGEEPVLSVVSPIHSLRPRVPETAPQLRQSMIAGGSSSLAPDEYEPTPEQDQPFDDPTKPSGSLRRSTSPAIVAAELDGKMKTKSTAMLAPPLSIDHAVPPPSTMNGSVIFSSVFVEKRDWNWSIRFLLGIHEPIRHALFVMDRFLEQSHRQQDIETLERHTSEFFQWFNTHFIEFFKTQHDIKLKVLHPLIKIKHSTKQEILRTYEEIGDILGQIQLQERTLLAGRAELDRGAWLLRLDTLQKGIRRLNMTVHGVLNLEEKTLQPALAQAFTEKTFRGYVMPRLFRAIKAKKVVVPWIVERSKVWGGEEEEQSFRGMLPMTSRFLYKKIWRPYFMSNVAVAMKNLNEFDLASQSPHGRREEFFGCVVQ